MTRVDVLAEIMKATRQPIWHLDGRECSIEIAARPAYCNRGDWIAKLEVGDLGFSLDDADGWPRYYFDLERAKAESRAWLQKRGLDIGAAWATVTA